MAMLHMSLSNETKVLMAGGPMHALCTSCWTSVAEA